MKLILIGILLHAGFADDTLCKSGQTGFDGSCYKKLEDAMTWQGANEACAARGGELVVPKSLSEHDYIWETFRERDTDIGVWVGCTRDQQDKEKWVHGEEECTYFNWGPDEPSSTGWEPCAEMKAYWYFSGKWNDQECSTQNSVICEHSTIQPYNQVKMTCLMADSNGHFAANE